jgi:hypothetical protein
MSLAAEVAAVEEVARELARGVRVSVVLAPQGQPRTRVFRLTDAGPGELVSVEGTGRLAELVAVSTTRGYELVVEVDGRVALSGSYDWFQSVSQYSDWVDAFDSNGTYVLRLSDVSFTSRLRVVMRASQPGVRLNFVVAKVELWGG